LQIYPGFTRNKFKKKTAEEKQNQDNFNIAQKKSEDLKKLYREKILNNEFVNWYKKTHLRRRNIITEKYLFKEFTQSLDFEPAKTNSLYISQHKIDFGNIEIEKMKFKGIYCIYISKK